VAGAQHEKDIECLAGDHGSALLPFCYLSKALTSTIMSLYWSDVFDMICVDW